MEYGVSHSVAPFKTIYSSRAFISVILPGLLKRVNSLLSWLLLGQWLSIVILKAQGAAGFIHCSQLTGH